MPSRRDQLFSYQFMVQRVVSAYAYRDAEAARVPFPRALSTLFIGIMVAVLALAAVGVFGVLSPGGKKTWRSDKALIVEKETGARYVYLNKRLHPVLNYVSARLILKSGNPRVVRVARASLRGTARGEPLGIGGVPDTLPDRKRLIRSRWTLCTRPAPTETGTEVAAAALYVGLSGNSGTGLGERAVLAKHPDGTVYLVWKDRRFPVRNPQVVLTALGLGQAPVVPAAPAWVNAIPLGPAIGPIAINGRGTPSGLPNALVGQVLVAQSQSGGEQYYVALADGIADITFVQADILLADPATAAAYPGRQVQRVERTDLATARRSATVLRPGSTDDAPPQRTPELAAVTEASPLCATFADAATPPQVTVGARLPAPGSGVKAAATGPNATADEVVVPAGEGVLVEAMVSPDAASGTLTVVTDLGMRYPLASRDVVGYLGYTEGSAVRMPAALVAMLREGPSLDPERATLPVGPA